MGVGTPRPGSRKMYQSSTGHRKPKPKRRRVEQQVAPELVQSQSKRGKAVGSLDYRGILTRVREDQVASAHTVGPAGELADALP